MSRAVRYTDFVQAHAVCRLLSGLDPQVIIDVGAYHGFYAILLAKFCSRSGGKVFAFEPDPDSYRVLRKNVALNALEECVITHQFAVGSRDCHCRLVSMGSESHVDFDSATGLQVEVVSLHTFLKVRAIRRVDLLMVDVEGAELSVLKGVPWSEVEVGNVFCELHPYAWHKFGYTGEDFQNFLQEHGFRVLDMYFKEHVSFVSEEYIGPCILVRR